MRCGKALPLISVVFVVVDDDEVVVVDVVVVAHLTWCRCLRG